MCVYVVRCDVMCVSCVCVCVCVCQRGKVADRKMQDEIENLQFQMLYGDADKVRERTGTRGKGGEEEEEAALISMSAAVVE